MLRVRQVGLKVGEGVEFGDEGEVVGGLGATDVGFYFQIPDNFNFPLHAQKQGLGLGDVFAAVVLESD